MSESNSRRSAELKSQIANEPNFFEQIYNPNDFYKIIQAQQNTINRLTQELSKKSQTISREMYEKTLNDLESEKYLHAKTKLELIELKETISSKQEEIEFYKNELEKERCAYANVYTFLKSKLLNESTKSIDLISKIAETEIRYNDALEGLNQKENKYSQMCGKIKQKEIDYEHKLEELNLKVEQEKYINNLMQEKSNKQTKSKTK